MVERDGDVFGDTVNLAARLTEMASRGQIITSLETVGAARADRRRWTAAASTRSRSRARRRKSGLCEMLWTDTDDATQLAASRATTDAGKQLRIVYHGRTVLVNEERRTLVLGRDATVD